MPAYEIPSESIAIHFARLAKENAMSECVEPHCTEEGVAGLHGAWLCLDHFQSRFQEIKDTVKRACREFMGVKP